MPRPNGYLCGYVRPVLSLVGLVFPFIIMSIIAIGLPIVLLCQLTMCNTLISSCTIHLVANFYYKLLQ